MTEPTAPLCVICSAHQQAPGILACARDAARLGDWLARLPEEYAALDANPSMQGRQPGAGGGGGLASQRSPVRLDVLVLRDGRSRDRDSDDPDGTAGRGVLEVLGSWARLVREQRQLTEPAHEVTYTTTGGREWTTTVLTPATVLSERRLLSVHLEWILMQDWVDEFASDLRAVWQQLRAANGHHAAKGVPCACGGSIRDIDGGARCNSCGTAWTVGQIVTSAEEAHRKQQEDARPRTSDGRVMWTAQEIVDAGLATSVNSVRVIAHRRSLERSGGYYDPEGYRVRALA